VEAAIVAFVPQPASAAETIATETHRSKSRRVSLSLGIALSFKILDFVLPHEQAQASAA
jgi:hypothetical protein